VAGPLTLCRDCDALAPGALECCSACASRRLVRHPELATLAIAHVDCDAFFASVEKRDRPDLADRPVLVGGGVRGVVTAACYVARLRGVRSAMPMFKALRACPDAVVIRPDFQKYVAAARQVRGLMQRLTPLVQPLSIDEAALDLSGTQALHGMAPAAVLARLARDVEREVGITVSIGLARNRLGAKLAAGRDKPRGFAVLGGDAAAVLAGESVRLLPGIGPAQARRLEARGMARLGQLQALDDRQARRLLGEDGPSLVRRARIEDDRLVVPARDSKSISAETTFDSDVADVAGLERHLWRCAEKVAKRLREQGLAAGGVTLKLKTHSFALRTRARRLAQPTRLPDTLFEAARVMLAREADGTRFRLIGLGAGPLSMAEPDSPDLADPDSLRRPARQAAIEALRARFGEAAIGRGRGWPPDANRSTRNDGRAAGKGSRVPP
jgi:DNA polymerase-4